ncbi:hypothetical protein KC332_g8824 [Hortaea werneckii]|uniref:Secreted protein n=1 Tax=Hortaea werneckii TaxID=91943 RepID=A0A3M7II84_HORWE|nr:hypothetical protein KC358_g3810 [Hortaea werneckii]KAI6848341.1 hypothetical protein KC350_g3056 [Hortaea werneckii]KAI6928141.1 hypothetical protein KC341_g11710 [Hortaea werneckii]KAI6945966.1 hypothetical protein KC348_g3454 [Hortaea werneckii]KAI6967723.1 hypothetical protein KC321_g8867 [Hortaea werneckii]
MHGLFAILAAAAPAYAALNVTFCSDSQCEQPALGSLRLDETDISKCHRDYAGDALAVKVQRWGHPAFAAKAEDAADEDSEDFSLAVRFYRSIDCFANCGSHHLIATGRPDLFFTLGFDTKNGRRVRYDKSVLQSFEIVRLDSDGKYPPHGYCGIRHGDAQSFRSRNWKWQQISKGVYHEIPIEDWDDDVHQPLDDIDYDRHGAVFSDGKKKLHQLSDQAWINIPLEEWDDQVHIKNSELDLADEEDDEEAAIEEEERKAGTDNLLTPQDDVHEYL